MYYELVEMVEAVADSMPGGATWTVAWGWAADRRADDLWDGGLRVTIAGKSGRSSITYQYESSDTTRIGAFDKAARKIIHMLCMNTSFYLVD